MNGSPLERIRPIDRGSGRLPAGTVRASLRSLILDGTLPPGSPLPQVELAERLGVSRTPLREALRMLQEEGLVEAHPNRRARVTGFDPQSLDALYAARILLEALGIQVTIARLTSADLEEIERSLAELEAATEGDELERWRECHPRFHALLVMHAGDHLKRNIEYHIDQCERYRHLHMLSEPRAWSAGREEHAEIVDACRRKDQRGAAIKLARHLGQTALSLMTQLAPEEEPRHVRAALSTIGSGGRSGPPADDSPLAR